MKRKAVDATSEDGILFQAILDKSVFFGPPEHCVRPSLFLSCGDSSAKRPRVFAQKLKKITKDRNHVFFKLDDAIEPSSYLKSSFLDVSETFVVVQGSSTGNEDEFKVLKEDYSKLVESILP